MFTLVVFYYLVVYCFVLRLCLFACDCLVVFGGCLLFCLVMFGFPFVWAWI